MKPKLKRPRGLSNQEMTAYITNIYGVNKHVHLGGNTFLTVKELDRLILRLQQFSDYMKQEQGK